MLQRIADQVRKYLCQTVRIGIETDGHQGILPFESHGIGTAELEQVLNALTEIVKIRRTLFYDNFARFYSGEIENLIDQALQAVVVALNDFEELHTVFWRVGLNDYSGETFNGIQGSTDFMAHVCKEERLHLTGFLCLLSLLLVFLELLVRNGQLLVDYLQTPIRFCEFL